MNDMTGWGTFIGVVCGAIGSLVTAIIMVWFKSSGKYQVDVMKAQAELNTAELLKAQVENKAKDQSIDILRTRVEQLEGNIKDLRDLGHSERDKWHAAQLKHITESMERESKCHAEAAELRGQLTILTKLVSDRLPGPLNVHVTNTPDDPVPVVRNGAAPEPVLAPA